MVYGTKYRIEYCDKYGRQARLDIEIKDYSGDVNMVEGTPDVFKLSYSNENGDKTGYIIHSVADISLYENPITIDDIKTLSETDIRISFYIDSVIFWQGFAIPDFFETEIGSNAVISISASDRISTLKKVTFTASLSREKLIKLISQCLLATGLDLPVVTVVDFLLEAEQSVHSGTDDLLGDMYGSRQRIVNDKGESISAFDVLRSILVLSNAYLVQRKNEWWIVNKEQIDYGYGNVRRYASDGTFISKTTFTQSVQSFRDIHIGGRKTIAAAALDVSVFSELGGAIVGNPDPFLELWVNNRFSAIQSENGATQHFSDKVVTGYSGSVALFGTETKKNALRIREQVYLGDNKPTMQPCFRVFVKQIVDAAYKIDLKIDVTGRTGMTVGYSIVVESIVGYTFLRLNSNGGWTMSIGSNISSGHIKSKQITGAVGGVSTMQITDSFNLDTDVDLGEGHGEYNIYILLFGTQGQAMDYFVESVQVRLNQLNEPPKGTIFKIEQKNDFSKSYETDTTVFGEYLNSGVNGYFYAFPENDSSIITLSSGYVPDPEWSTINDQNPETLLMKGVRQRADSLSTARSVLSVSMEIKDIDPLAIFKASCNNDRFSLVECQFDFLKSTAILKLEERTSSSALKKDFIYSYFGDRDDDNIRSIGTASGSTTVGSPPPSSGGGGSFLDKYFSYDEGTESLIANVNLASEKEIAAWTDGGNLPPTIWDAMPFATSESAGGIKAASTFQNGIRINSSGFLEVDPSYADSGVSSWNDLTNRPTWLTPTTKELFEAGHGHTWSQITSKPTAFTPTTHTHTPSQVGLGNVGNYSDYARKGQNETITGGWDFRRTTIIRSPSNANTPTLGSSVSTSLLALNSGGQYGLLFGVSGTGRSWIQGGRIDGSVSTYDIQLQPSGGNVGIGLSGNAPATEKLHVVGNGLFTGNLTANNGTFNGLMKVTHLSPRYEFHQTDVQNACRWVLDNDLIQMQVIEYGTSLFSHTPFTISLNAPTGSFRVNSTGSVTTGSDLYVGGNITAQGEVTAYSSSDQRLKKNIKTIESAIDTINKLNPVSFNWNEKAIDLNSAKDSDRVNYGVIAQEIERVLPELVHQTNGYKSVDYQQLIMILAKAIQELKLEIEELKNK